LRIAHGGERRLAQQAGWQLTGDGDAVAIEKRYGFANYFETLAFVNAVALIAHRQDHHPSLAVEYGSCTVRFNTHDVGGISSTDFDCAAAVDALLA
jgi:4a-hydroxytetrahydrobiopterin dehydratase